MLNQFKLFDAHLHIIDSRFPLTENQGYLPECFNAQDYLLRMHEYDLCGGVVVSASFQSFDQSYLLDALRTLGPSYVGVTQLPFSTSDTQIFELNQLGVRAVRFNLLRGGSEDIRYLAQMAHRVYELVGWHVELYLDSASLPEIMTTILSLPRVSIDHLGISQAGFHHILRLAQHGVRIKACGFSRGDLKVHSALLELYAVNPASLMFGSDLPCTRAPVVYSDRDFALVFETLGDKAARRVFSQNAIEFYTPNSSMSSNNSG